MLKPGDVVSMDNLGSYKSREVRQMIKSANVKALVSAPPIRQTSIRSRQPNTKIISRALDMLPIRPETFSITVAIIFWFYNTLLRRQTGVFASTGTILK